jgi:hypothetical protein
MSPLASQTRSSRRSATLQALAWVVLALVFLDELLAAAAAAVWGRHVAGLLLAVAMVLVVISLWWAFASPKAPHGGPVTRPAVKVLVFGAAGLGLWAIGHHAWAVAFVVFSVAVNALARLRAVRDVAEQAPGASQ